MAGKRARSREPGIGRALPIRKKLNLRSSHLSRSTSPAQPHSAASAATAIDAADERGPPTAATDSSFEAIHTPPSSPSDRADRALDSSAAGPSLEHLYGCVVPQRLPEHFGPYGRALDWRDDTTPAHSALGSRLGSSAPEDGSDYDSDADMATEVDPEDKLEAHNIVIRSKGDPPPELLEHLQKVIWKDREPGSPTPRRIAVMASEGVRMSEAALIAFVGDDMLFTGELDRSRDPNGIQGITNQPDLNLYHHWLPAAPSDYAKAMGTLSKPRPDTLIGYVRNSRAREARKQPVLSTNEARVLNLKQFDLAADRNIALPFFTCQWKASEGHAGGLSQAERQGARDGAAIVNNLHTIWERSGLPYNAVDTSFFSGACDGRSFNTFLHWMVKKPAQKPEFHSRQYGEAFFQNTRDSNQPGLGMVDMRRDMRNIVEYSMSGRLTRLKLALDTIYKKLFPNDSRPVDPNVLFPQPNNNAQVQASDSDSDSDSPSPAPEASAAGKKPRGRPPGSTNKNRKKRF